MTAAHNMASQMEDSEPALLGQSKFDGLMQAITGCQSSLSTLTTKIDTVQLEVSRIRQEFDKIRQRVTETERRLGITEDLVCDHTASLHTLQVRVRSLESRAEDAENRNRRNNLRIVGLPEGAEGPDPAAYTERLLHTLFSQVTFSSFFAVERAHRMPSQRGLPGSPLGCCGMVMTSPRAFLQHQLYLYPPTWHH